MVIFSIKPSRPLKFGVVCSLLYFTIFLISIINAIRIGNDDPQLVAAFFGFPFSWLLFSVFHPLLEWIGPFSSVTRRVAEWVVLGFAGVVQYGLIGVLIAYLTGGKRIKDFQSAGEQNDQ